MDRLIGDTVDYEYSSLGNVVSLRDTDQLTDWVLESACRSLREWSDAGLPSVPLSINLAASSLSDISLTVKLEEAKADPELKELRSRPEFRKIER